MRAMTDVVSELQYMNTPGNIRAVGIDLGGTKKESILLDAAGNVLARRRRPTPLADGYDGIAGEWGHISMDSNGAECYCGNRGCIETLISGSGVERTFLSEFGYQMSMNDIVAHARRGETRSVRIFDRFLEDFGRCVGGLISLLDPDAVVIGGGLSNIDEIYTVGIEQVKRYAFHDNLNTPVLKNRLGDSAGVFGAAWIGRSIL